MGSIGITLGQKSDLNATGVKPKYAGKSPGQMLTKCIYERERERGDKTVHTAQSARATQHVRQHLQREWTEDVSGGDPSPEYLYRVDLYLFLCPSSPSLLQLRNTYSPPAPPPPESFNPSRSHPHRITLYYTEFPDTVRSADRLQLAIYN